MCLRAAMMTTTATTMTTTTAVIVISTASTKSIHYLLLRDAQKRDEGGCMSSALNTMTVDFKKVKKTATSRLGSWTAQAKSQQRARIQTKKNFCTELIHFFRYKWQLAWRCTLSDASSTELELKSYTEIKQLMMRPDNNDRLSDY